MNHGRRRTDGDETWNRLLEWTKGQKAAERLAGHIIHSSGYTSIDPSHPLGGKDSLKDFICAKDGVIWIGAAYFPRGHKDFKTIKKKFLSDLEGVYKNSVEGIIFITNQELTITERKKLMSVSKSTYVEVFHLERLVHILNNPINYGIRLEFLDIEITTEEQLAYFAERDKTILELSEKIDQITKRLTQGALSTFHEKDIKINALKEDEYTDECGTEEGTVGVIGIDNDISEFKKKIINEIFMIENYYGQTELFKPLFEIHDLDLSKTRVIINELLAEFYDITTSLSKVGITNIKGLELASYEEIPAKLELSFGMGVPIRLLQKIIGFLSYYQLEYLHFVDYRQEDYDEYLLTVVIGTYSYQDTNLDLIKIDHETLEKLLDPLLTANQFYAILIQDGSDPCIDW
ncbi:hypothetical protein [Brevibacillus fortis]|uniref:Uncharacterized protein n=1 Tax=Brevibacillus fortis TaxID=2126352 RepID=A0A2P7VH33_9BACL|nr:hypothetical protein [Brevibacillus fortis]PSJ98524.1 hypothetical protein C7R93_06165 [Brevibacillus fortis]